MLTDRAKQSIINLQSQVELATNRRDIYLEALAEGAGVDLKTHGFDFKTMDFVEKPKKGSNITPPKKKKK